MNGLVEELDSPNLEFIPAEEKFLWLGIIAAEPWSGSAESDGSDTL
jgi:hypothetical protein